MKLFPMKAFQTLALCLGIFSLTACGEVVETGERGVKTNFGEVTSESLPEGLYFYNPFTEDIYTLDVKTLVRSGISQAYTKDIQRAAESQNKTVQVEEEAKQKVIAAQADAESMRIRSEALEKNQNLVAYEAVQRWDGVMPVYVMGDSMPMIQIPNNK